MSRAEETTVVLRRVFARSARRRKGPAVFLVRRLAEHDLSNGEAPEVPIVR